jgi:hypothetical protein
MMMVVVMARSMLVVMVVIVAVAVGVGMGVRVVGVVAVHDVRRHEAVEESRDDLYPYEAAGEPRHR